MDKKSIFQSCKEGFEMCLVNYELATQLYNDDTRHDEIKSVEQVKREVNEIISKSTLTGETLTEQGAFMEWLLINDIKEQYLEKYKELVGYGLN
jgi:hypothetical protein